MFTDLAATASLRFLTLMVANPDPEIAKQADAWFELLGHPAVRNQDMNDFAVWRKDPAARAAWDDRVSRSEIGEAQREAARQTIIKARRVAIARGEFGAVVREVVGYIAGAVADIVGGLAMGRSRRV